MGTVPINQRINNNDRIEYNAENPFKINKMESTSSKTKIISSNIITRFPYSTREGFSVNNANKKNQDNFILAPNMNSSYHQHFFAVLDGHG